MQTRETQTSKVHSSCRVQNTLLRFPLLLLSPFPSDIDIEVISSARHKAASYMSHATSSSIGPPTASNTATGFDGFDPSFDCEGFAEEVYNLITEEEPEHNKDTILWCHSQQTTAMKRAFGDDIPCPENTRIAAFDSSNLDPTMVSLVNGFVARAALAGTASTDPRDFASTANTASVIFKKIELAREATKAKINIILGDVPSVEACSTQGHQAPPA